jgi:hypothetical protein
MCGNTPSQGMNWIINRTQATSNNQRTMLVLEFPLCQECYTVSRDKGFARFLAVMRLPIAIMLLFFGFSIIENYLSGWPLFVASSWALIIIGVVVVSTLPNTINQKGFSSEQRERRKRVKRCVNISYFKAPGLFNKKGSIVFRFENPLFAREFATMNSGELS